MIESNLITKQEMAAINGPMARDDGSLVTVVPTKNAWQYVIQPADLTQPKSLSSEFKTSLEARKALLPHLNASEQKMWQEPYKELNVGEPWRKLRIGNTNVSNEGVFVRACYTGNEFLANQVVGEFKRRYAADSAGNSVSHYAALASEQLLKKFNDIHSVNFRRSNTNKQTPAHFAQGNMEKLEYIVSKNGSVFQKDAFQKSPLDTLNKDQKNHLTILSMKMEQEQKQQLEMSKKITHQRDPSQTIKRQ